MTSSHTKRLVSAALMIALSVVLSMITIFQLPQGGDITAFSMVPVIVMSFRYGPKWGVYTGFGFGLIKMLLGLNNVFYCPTLLSQIGCILLDYILPFSCLGLASYFAHFFKNHLVGVTIGSGIVCLIRFICSFLSGILLWGAYAPEGTPVYIYSFVYNISYMLPETILTVVCVFFLYKTSKKLFASEIA